MPLWLKLLFDIGGLLPVSAEAHDAIEIMQDLVALGVVIQALPQTQALEAKVKAWVKAHGGTYTEDDGGRMVSYTVPPHPGGLYPGMHGSSMYQGSASTF